MNRETAELICPNCGYCLGQQDLFRVYERKVADWLNGEICASLNPNFDVWKCAEFPGLTFQVKFANIYHYTGKAKRHRQAAWPFNQHKMNNDGPDYFVLFGVTDEGQEHCFLLSKDTFVEHSSRNSTGGRIMLMTPNRFSRRGGRGRSYVNENKVWKYEVKNPEENLIGRVQTLESYHQFELPI